jgi:tetratricopeptide (TPR) repeat protein
MTDALTTNLAEIGDLTVISRAAAMQYKGKRQLSDEIARELHVDALVEGSVVRSTNRVRIAAQLVDPTTNRNVWSKSYERDLGDIVDLQSEVAKAIAAEIEVELQPREQALLSRTRLVKPEAYDYYLRGHLYSYRESVADNEVAIGMLEHAVALDADFAPSYAELADAYRVRFTQFAPQEKHWEEKAFRAADKALALDSNLAEAYVARGFLLWTPSKGFRHKEAIQEYRQALSLNPNLDEAHHYLGNIFIHIGLLDQGIGELQRAVAINPSNTPARARIGVALLYQGKCEQALGIFQSNLWEANQTLRGYQIAWSLFCLGKTNEAFSTLDEYLKKYPADEGGLLSSMQALLYGATGQQRLAEAKIGEAQKGRGFVHFHHTEYNIASAYALMHKSGLAIQWLQKSAAEGFPCYPVFARDPNLANLRDDARFIEFMGKQKQQWETFRSAI